MKKKLVVVVGGGMGGLAAGIELAAAGHAVTLFERAATVGGKMREVQVGGVAIDSGPTVFTMRWIFEALFRNAGKSFDDYVTLDCAELLARHLWSDGGNLDLFADLGQSLDAIKEFSGASQARAYERFVTESGRMFDTLDHTFMRAPRPGPVQLTRNVGIRNLPDLLATRPFTTLHRYLKQRFNDPRLVQLFGRYATYCGSSPYDAPATLALIAEAERRGVWAVRGGMQRLADGMARLLTDLGGQIVCATEVRTLCTDGGRCTGVELADGTRQQADAVIFNGDTQALAEGLLGESAQNATAARDGSGFSLSAITWSLLAAPTGTALAHHTVCFGDDYVEEFSATFKRSSICQSPTVYVCAAPQGVADSTVVGQPLFCLVNAPAGGVSSNEVDAAESAMLSQLKRCGVELALDRDRLVRTTPTDFATLFPASRGSLYGRPTHGALGSFSRPGAPSKIHRLYLSGGSVHPGAGIPMATQSGRLAAQRALRDLSS